MPSDRSEHYNTGGDRRKRRLHGLKGHQENKSRRLQTMDPAAQHQPPLTADMVRHPKSMPAGLKPEFNNARDQILELDIATVGDVFSVQMLCLAWAEYSHLSFMIFQEGYIVEGIGSKGQPVQKVNPLLAVRRGAMQLMMPMLKEFGLTAFSRKKIFKRDPERGNTKEERKEDNEWDDLIN